MATEAPSWADQWGAGGIGALEEDDTTAQKESNNKKANAKGGLSKVKATFSSGIKWVKHRCQKKGFAKGK